MKSFKKYIGEAYNDMSTDVKGRVPTDDLHRFSSDSKVLGKLNTWIGSIADREYITVEVLHCNNWEERLNRLVFNLIL